MPTYDCSADVNIRVKISDCIEADTSEEADKIFAQRWEAGEYEDQLSEERNETFFSWGAKEN